MEGVHGELFAQDKDKKKMRMNIQIGDYEVYLVILDLGSDVNILTR